MHSAITRNVAYFLTNNELQNLAQIDKSTYNQCTENTWIKPRFDHLKEFNQILKKSKMQDAQPLEIVEEILEFHAKIKDSIYAAYNEKIFGPVLENLRSSLDTIESDKQEKYIKAIHSLAIELRDRELFQEVFEALDIFYPPCPHATYGRGGIYQEVINSCKIFDVETQFDLHLKYTATRFGLNPYLLKAVIDKLDASSILKIAKIVQKTSSEDFLPLTSSLMACRLGDLQDSRAFKELTKILLSNSEDSYDIFKGIVYGLAEKSDWASIFLLATEHLPKSFATIMSDATGPSVIKAASFFNDRDLLSAIFDRMSASWFELADEENEGRTDFRITSCIDQMASVWLEATIAVEKMKDIPITKYLLDVMKSHVSFKFTDNSSELIGRVAQHLEKLQSSSLYA